MTKKLTLSVLLIFLSFLTVTKIFADNSAMEMNPPEGNHLLAYYSDNSVSSEAETFSVKGPDPGVTLPAFDPVCGNAEPFMLTGGEPVGGEYSGDGVVDGFFYPENLAAGIYEITYTFVDDDGISFQATNTIEVLPLPCADIIHSDVTCYDAGDGTIEVNIDETCADVVSINLSLLSQKNAEFTPTKKSLTYAFYNNLGPGLYYVTIIAANGCTIVEEVDLQEPPLPEVDLTLPANICIDEPEFDLYGGSPAGGTYFVDNNETTTFNPSQLGAGTYEVVYFYTDEDGCSNTAEQT
ncbi:MAG: hypothetical protein ACLFQS_11600, partial [Bacteroidales bacterium]